MPETETETKFLHFLYDDSLDVILRTYFKTTKGFF